MSYDFKPEEIAISSWPSGTPSGFVHRPIHGIRVIHIPTCTVVTCETERSQHRNREIALQQLWERVQGKPSYEELAAQVEAFKSHLASFGKTETLEDAVKWEDDISALVNATPENHLSARDAEVARDAIKAVLDLPTFTAEHGSWLIKAIAWDKVLPFAEQYAAQLRAKTAG